MTANLKRSWKKALLPTPYEITGYPFCVLAYFLLSQLPVHYPVLSLIPQALSRLWQFMALALAAVVLASLFRDLRKHWKKPSEWWRAMRDSRLLSGFFWHDTVRMILAIILVLAFHFLCKSAVFLFNPKNWDSQLFQFDQILHFGVAPSIFFVELFRSAMFYRLIDLVYSFCYFLVNLTYPAIIFAFGTSHVARTFTTAYILTAIIGLALYIAVPSWGPVFTHPQEFEDTLQEMPLTVHVQTQLHKETLSLVRDPMAHRTIVYGGIAAFPSLHIAFVMVFVLTSRCISRAWFRANLVLCLLMLIGSLVTGYHYLIDGYAGIMLGWGLFILSDKWIHHWERKHKLVSAKHTLSKAIDSRNHAEIESRSSKPTGE